MCSDRAWARATCWRAKRSADPPPEVVPTDPPEARGGGGTRNSVPLYDVPAHRILHHLVRRPPVRTSALRGLAHCPTSMPSNA